MAATTKEKEAFAKRFRIVRDRFDMSQEKFAEYLGCSKNTVSRYENGNTMPDIYTLLHIVNVCQIDITELVPEMAALNKTNGGWNQIIFKTNRLNDANKEVVMRTTNAMVDNFLDVEKKIHS